MCLDGTTNYNKHDFNWRRSMLCSQLKQKIPEKCEKFMFENVNCLIINFNVNDAEESWHVVMYEILSRMRRGMVDSNVTKNWGMWIEWILEIKMSNNGFLYLNPCCCTRKVSRSELRCLMTSSADFSVNKNSDTKLDFDKFLIVFCVPLIGSLWLKEIS